MFAGFYGNISLGIASGGERFSEALVPLQDPGVGFTAVDRRELAPTVPLVDWGEEVMVGYVELSLSNGRCDWKEGLREVCNTVETCR